MNYIKQLTGFFEMVSKDYRLNATHISLYMAMFQYWNLNRFRNPISISRNELMEISKISGRATYHKVIRELHNFGYIKYEPSYNSYRGSLVYMFNFELSDPSNSQSDFRTSDSPPLEQIKSCADEEQEPYINNINLLNIKNNLNYLYFKKDRSSNFEQVDFDLETSDDGRSKEKEEKSCAKKEEKERGGPCNSKQLKPVNDEIAIKIPGKKMPPSLEEVIEFFRSESYPELEAKNFFYYFSSKDWMIGDNAPMRDWHSGSHSWMLMATKFKKHETYQRNNYSGPRPGHLHDANDRNKDYSEPL